MPNVTCDTMALNKTELLPWDVNAYWDKERAKMTVEDIALIDKDADLSVQGDAKWAELREVYESNLSILRASEGSVDAD